MEAARRLGVHEGEAALCAAHEHSTAEPVRPTERTLGLVAVAIPGWNGLVTLNTEPTPSASLSSAPKELRGPGLSMPRRGRIVIGIDGSDASLAALTHGLRLATALNTNVEVVTAWGYPDDFGATPTIDNWSPKRDAVETLATSVEKVLPGALPAWITTHTIQGHTANALVKASVGAEMLIVGSRGHGGIVGVLLGSVSSRCAELAKCPVLVMH